MESAWPLLLFLAGLVGCMLLMLVCGIQSRELERAEAGEGTAAAGTRSFFATLEEAFAPRVGVDDATVRHVERRLRLLTEQADRFIEEPTIDRFHDFGEQGQEESLFCRFQRFLEQERAMAREFVADPSFDRLHEKHARQAI